MQVPIETVEVRELTLELKPRPWWALLLLAALYLGGPKLADTGENWGRTNPDGGNNYHPVPSGVLTRLTVTGNTAQGAGASGSIGWAPSVVLGRKGVGRTGGDKSVVLVPNGATTNMVGIGTSGSETTSANRLFYVKGHVRGAQCIWIKSSPRCAGDWQ